MFWQNDNHIIISRQELEALHAQFLQQFYQLRADKKTPDTHSLISWNKKIRYTMGVVTLCQYLLGTRPDVPSHSPLLGDFEQAAHLVNEG